ncbi:MAG: transcription repressor NadR [Synergistales bacterium]
MERNERLGRIAELLQAATEPLSGTGLAERFGVSRQAIVQDIARLRDSGCAIRATAAGYSLDRLGCGVRRLIAVRHRAEDVREELLAIVGQGGRVIDVIVDHPIYGELRGNIDAATPEEVHRFVNLLESTGRGTLSSLSGGFHLHTIEADSEEILDRVESVLGEKGFLGR